MSEIIVSVSLEKFNTYQRDEVLWESRCNYKEGATRDIAGGLLKAISVEDNTEIFKAEICLLIQSTDGLNYLRARPITYGFEEYCGFSSNYIKELMVAEFKKQRPDLYEEIVELWNIVGDNGSCKEIKSESSEGYKIVKEKEECSSVELKPMKPWCHCDLPKGKGDGSYYVKM